VGWKTSRGNKFYDTNIWTFEKRVDKFLQLIEPKDGVTSDIKIIVDDNHNKKNSGPK